MCKDCNDIIKGFDSDDLECRRLAAEKLAKLDHLSKSAKNILIEHLDSDKEHFEDVREWCAYAIGHKRVSEATDALLHAFKKDKVRNVKIMVERAMGRISSPGFVQPLSSQLESTSDEKERRTICLALLDGALVNTDYKKALVGKAMHTYLVPGDVLLMISKMLPSRQKSRYEEELELYIPEQIPMLPPDPPNIVEVNIVSREESRIVSQIVYDRNRAIKEMTLKDRGATCQMCGALPFKQKNGDDYAEVHHIQLLLEEGHDRDDNLLVVCPTCHRKLHFADATAHFDLVQCRYIDMTINGETFKVCWN